MILYAESSAILAWLLNEPSEQDVVECLRQARSVHSSDLTRVEVGRALTRLLSGGRLSATEIAGRRLAFEQRVAKWTFIQLAPTILERAQAAFPVEPVRAMDALHLASALETPALAAVLSLDQRIRANADALGLSAVP